MHLVVLVFTMGLLCVVVPRYWGAPYILFFFAYIAVALVNAPFLPRQDTGAGRVRAGKRTFKEAHDETGHYAEVPVGVIAGGHADESTMD